METRKRAWIVALSLVLASSGVAVAAPADDVYRDDGAPSIWQEIWSQVTGWLFGLDEPEPRSVRAEGQSNAHQGTPAPAPAPAPPSTQSEGDSGGMLDPSG